MTTAHEIQDELKASGGGSAPPFPEVYAGYAPLHPAAMGHGALPAGVKELIALTIAVTGSATAASPPTRGGPRAGGVTTAEVAEAMGVAILMNGGPATVWGPRARRLRGVRGGAGAGARKDRAGKDRAGKDRAGEVSPPGS